MDDTHVITVQDLRRRYGPPGGRGFDAVRGVSFSVRRGELFALLGTNGAGKTSTLEVLEGLAAPTSGVVRVLGRDPFRGRRLVRHRIGIMLQQGGFPADLTVAERSPRSTTSRDQTENASACSRPTYGVLRRGFVCGYRPDGRPGGAAL